MVSMEQNSGLQTELRAKAWERWTKRQAGQGFLGGGGGEYIFIFLVLKVPRKVNMNLKDKFIYLFTLCLFQKPLKVSYNMHNAARFFF